VVLKPYSRINDIDNEKFRIEWTERQLTDLLLLHPGLEILDIGAGSSPFRKVVERNNGVYLSHDFNLYIPSKDGPGIQNNSWDYAQHVYVCDIMDIPTDRKFDVILCTEVLEHLPDPVDALKLMFNLLKPKGIVIVTVPFLSLMHQAPYWFSSGLSPYWFIHWSEKYQIKVKSLLVSGDYLDLIQQELYRLIANVIRVPVIRRLANLAQYLRFIRRFIPKGILMSGGFGTFYVGEKP
jgi:SAM-dependent methyltransferase